MSDLLLAPFAFEFMRRALLTAIVVGALCSSIGTYVVLRKLSFIGDGIAHADVIIEAIFENLEAKRQLFVALEAKANPTALLATNTSSIPLEQLCEGLQRPERLLGLHFFNPVSRMQLVEVISHGGV